MNDTTACPCNSGLSYANCCEPLIKNVSAAASPEALMRARYSAFVHQEMSYLLETLHPSQRSDYDPEGAAKWAREADWTSLEILDIKGDPELAGVCQNVTDAIEIEVEHRAHGLGVELHVFLGRRR